MSEDALQVFAFLIIAVSVASAISTAYLWIVWWRSPILRHPIGRSRIFRDWAITSTIITLGAGLIVYPAIRAAFELPRIPFTGILVIAALGLCFIVPMYLGARVFLIRRRVRRRRAVRREASQDPEEA